MKYLYLFLIITLLSFSFIGCEAGEDVPLSNLDGKYVGYFQRTVGKEPGHVSQIRLKFTSNTWEGHSDTPQYPALCKGTYELKGSKILFENNCFFTADFDWSLILNGEYTVKYSGNTVTMTKVISPENQNQIIDVFTLQPIDAIF